MSYGTFIEILHICQHIICMKYKGLERLVTAATYQRSINAHFELWKTSSLS